MAQLDRPFNPRGVQVIPDGWEARHAPIAEDTATAEVAIWSGAVPQWRWDDAEQKQVRDLGDELWSGLARVQQRRNTAITEAGSQDVTTHAYLVTLPRDVPLGQWVQVVESSDPELGLLRVVDVLKGSLRWERDLLCTDNLGEVPR